jgi:hypothetical protein
MMEVVEKDHGDRREEGGPQEDPQERVNHREEANHRNSRETVEQEGVDHRSSQRDAVRRAGKSRMQARVAGPVASKRCRRVLWSLCRRRFRGSSPFL